MAFLFAKRALCLAMLVASVPLAIGCSDDSSESGPGTDPTDPTDPFPAGKILQIDAGRDHVCAIGSFGLQCWGRQEGVLVQDGMPQNVTDPISLSTGVYSNCVIDAKGTQCWGLVTSGVNDVPALSNPRVVSTSHFHACAIDDDGVKCWGVNEFNQIDVPPDLNQPIMVSAGETHTCVVEIDGAVVCWGSYDGIDLTNLPTLTDPKKMHEGNCALDGTQLSCWEGVGYSDGSFDGVHEIRDFQLGNGYACVTGNELRGSQSGPIVLRVACSGNMDSGTHDFPTDLLQPTQIATGSSFACAVESNDRLRCWGSSAGSDDGNVPLLFEPTE
jgi:alpha-tubulin suppressor-like RCC1 family protein